LPVQIDSALLQVGFRIIARRSWHLLRQGLSVAFANDGIAGVPRALRVYAASDGSLTLQPDFSPDDRLHDQNSLNRGRLTGLQERC
jgi:hypothetical protein